MGEIISSKEIGIKIKMLRQQAGLSQEKLAEIVGVTFQQIQKYENGNTTLNVLKLQQIASALKIPANLLLESPPICNTALTHEEDKLLQSFRKIKSGDTRSAVLTLVGNLNRKNR